MAADLLSAELLSSAQKLTPFDPAAIKITALSIDSRDICPGTMFFALPGEKVDGAKFLPQAEAAGAALAIAAKASAPLIAQLNLKKLPVLLLENPRAAVSEAASRLFPMRNKPADFIGVTGTNGKTSVAWIISEALSHTGRGTAYIGTLGQRTLAPGGAELRFDLAVHTTPEAVELHHALLRAKGEGAEKFAVEVSSHGIAQHRVDNIPFGTAIFTNLTRDHLDFHKTFESYFETKLRLFTGLNPTFGPPPFAVINIDDEFGRTIPERLAGLPVKLIRTSRAPGNNPAEIRTLSSRTTRHGIELEAEIAGEKVGIKSGLVGDYNVLNLMSAIGALFAQGMSPQLIARALIAVRPAPGRLELAAQTEPAVYVDYAHTPDGLINALGSIRKLREADSDGRRGRIITVFGCGGDRDRGKRPQMGRAAAELSDMVVVTSDNPRSEDPEAIIADILPGLPAAGATAEVIADRRAAIRRAIELANKEDIVLVAGKGHETYQEICGVRHPFSDIEICRETLLLQ